MISNPELVLRLLLAALLGSMIGVEQERRLWAAGLRIHMPVSVGACLFMIVSTFGFSRVLGPHVILDPSRIAAQVVTGVGVLGAGSIVLRNDLVKGLTTATGLWAAAAAGLAVGGGLYLVAVAATAIILGTLAGIKFLEERYRSARQTVELRLTAERGVMSVGLLRQALGGRAARVEQLVVRPGEAIDQDEVSVTLGKVTPKDVADTIECLARLPKVSDVREAAFDPRR